MHGRSRMTIDPRIPTVPGRSTSGSFIHYLFIFLNEQKRTKTQNVTNRGKKRNKLWRFCRNVGVLSRIMNGHIEYIFVFEKTPNNNNILESFLDSTKDSYFINIVRNPLYVYRSLKKRGSRDNIALTNWMFEAAKTAKYLNHERVITVKYEDLIKDPYKIASDLILKCSGYKISEDTIEHNYQTNLHRKHFSIKLPTWSNKKNGVVINANNLEEDSMLLKAFRPALDLKINPIYGRIFQLHDYSYKELLSIYNYDIDFNTIKNYKTFKFNWGDKKKLYGKWKFNFRSGEAKLKDFNAYLNPIEFDSQEKKS